MFAIYKSENENESVCNSFPTYRRYDLADRYRSVDHSCRFYRELLLQFDTYSGVQELSEAFISLTTTKLTSYCLAYFMDSSDFFQIRSFQIEQNQFCFSYNGTIKTRFIKASRAIILGEVGHNKLTSRYFQKQINRTSLKCFQTKAMRLAKRAQQLRCNRLIKRYFGENKREKYTDIFNVFISDVYKTSEIMDKDKLWKVWKIITWAET